MRNPDLRPETVLRPAALTPDQLIRGLRLLPQYRELFLVLTSHRVRVRYRQSALGPLWALLQPVAMMLIFAAVFSIIAPLGVDHPYAAFAYAGLLPWTAFASALASGAGSLTTHAALVTRVHFPREILPASYVAVAMLDLAVASVVLAGLLMYYDIALSPAALWLIPAVIVLAAWSAAMALVLAAVNVRFRDVSIAMPLLLQFWMFASPVIYPLSAVPQAWRPLYLANPMAGIVDTFRRAVLDAAPPDTAAFSSAAIVTAMALPLAYVWFKHTDATMADRI